MKFKNLEQWLGYIESIHSTEIDLGLSRITLVAERLHINLSASTVITVAGTNGKGTTCAFIESALIKNGSSVAVYSSPHINLFNERLRLNKCDVEDLSLIEAFEKVEKARGEVSLSYYEFTTLACLLVVQELEPDYVILEVGLGGRLDATNIIDADVAVITTIDLDHQEFLGDTREKIGFEKAGILRAERNAVIGDLDMPNSIKGVIDEKQVKALCRHQDFTVDLSESSWQYHSAALNLTLQGLNLPHIPIDNVATGITVLSLLDIALTPAFINDVIDATKVPGRLELVQSKPDVLLDVGHNPQAARYLAGQLERRNYENVIAVVGMLTDKDAVGTLSEMKDVVTHWFVGNLTTPRGADVTVLENALNSFSANSNAFDNVVDAYKMAINTAGSNDAIIVFGSFFTVSEVKSYLTQE